MAKTKRFARRTQSTPAGQTMNETTSHGSTQSEPIGVQNDQEDQVENQNFQQNEVELESSLPTRKRKSHKYWTVGVIDESGIRTEEKFKVRDLYSLPNGKKVILDWNRHGQPIGEAAGLLGGFLGSLAANYNIFPIGATKWPKVSDEPKDNVWNKTIKKVFQVNEHHKKYIMANIGKKWKDTRSRLFGEFYDPSLTWDENLEARPDDIKIEDWEEFLKYRLSEKTLEICEKNIANKEKQTLFHSLGTKTLARTQYELETQTGRSYSRAEMFSIAYTTKDGTFVSDEAREKNDQLSLEEEMSPGDDNYARVFGKEHPGRVRGVGFGPVPSEWCHKTGNESSSKYGNTTTSDVDQLKSELLASNARVKVLEEQMAFIMQHLGGIMPTGFNQATDLGSPMEATPSSSATHAPSNHGPSTTI